MKKPTPFGKYCLLERISVGGMAEVFKSKTFGVQGFSKIIAIKRILPAMAEDRDFVTMFIDEAKIAVQLNHANICQIYELGKINSSHYIAMEYIHGKDLLQLQNRFKRDKKPMPWEMACYAVQKVCEGLDYAHRKKDASFRDIGLVHRDISPQNILISFDGEVKIIDFGIAKAASRSTRTQVGVLKGKFGYMSPEQVRGLSLDHRSDIFAAGTVLYEVLAGRRLFIADSDFATLEKVRKVDIEPLRSVVPDVPPELERIVLKALAREREERYQWAREMAEDLGQFLLKHRPGYSNKELADWMRSAYQEELAEEKRKMEAYARLSSPDDLVNWPEETSPSQAELPARGPRHEDPLPIRIEDAATKIFAYNLEAAVEGLAQGLGLPAEALRQPGPAQAESIVLLEAEPSGPPEEATEAMGAISDEEYARIMEDAVRRQSLVASAPEPVPAASAAQSRGAAPLFGGPAAGAALPFATEEPSLFSAPSLPAEIGPLPAQRSGLAGKLSGEAGTMNLSSEELLPFEEEPPAAPSPRPRAATPAISSAASDLGATTPAGGGGQEAAGGPLQQRTVRLTAQEAGLFGPASRAGLPAPVGVPASGWSGEQTTPDPELARQLLGGNPSQGALAGTPPPPSPPSASRAVLPSASRPVLPSASRPVLPSTSRPLTPPAPRPMTPAPRSTPPAVTGSFTDSAQRRPLSGSHSARRPRQTRKLLLGLLVVALLGVGGVAAWRFGPQLARLGRSGEATLTLLPASPVQGELKITLDEREIGASLPVTVEKLRAGGHELRIESGLYEPLRTKIELPATGTTEHRIKLRIAPEMMARLQLQVRPAGPFSVLLDGRKLLEADAARDKVPVELPPGREVELKVERSGFLTYRAKLTMTAKEQRDEFVELLPLEGIIQLNSEPPRASVFIDGKRVGQTPFVSKKLSGERTYDLRLRKAGYEEWQEDVRFDGERPTWERRVELARVGAASAPDDEGAGGQGYLIVTAGMDEMAHISVDGRDTGKSTPLSEYGKIPLPVGEHTITLERGGSKAEGKVVIEAGRTARLKLRLP